MKTFLEEIRLPDEKKILDYLEKVLNVGTISDLLSFDANQKKDRSMSGEMLFNLPLSPQVGGQLHELTQEILQLLEYTDREVAFYISNDEKFNAMSHYSRNEEEPHYVVFNSGIVERHTDEEMRFVIAHELGHLIYRHSMLEFVIDHLYPSGPPDFIKNIFHLWRNLGEMSCDRVGSLAVGNFDAAASAMFKMSSGLDMGRFQVKTMNFMAMNDKLVADMSVAGQNYLVNTHPVNPLRIKALDVFYHSATRKNFLKSRKLVRDNKLRRQTDELVSLLKVQPADDDDRACLDFLTAAGCYLINSDGNTATQELDELINMLSNFHSWPPDYVHQVMKHKKPMTIINKSASVILDKCPSYISMLFRLLVPLIAKDQRITQNEIDALLLIAGKLKLTKPEAVEMILEEIRGKYQPMA